MVPIPADGKHTCLEPSRSRPILVSFKSLAQLIEDQAQRAPYGIFHLTESGLAILVAGDAKLTEITRRDAADILGGTFLTRSTDPPAADRIQAPR
jgi:hypothetical protein